MDSIFEDDDFFKLTKQEEKTKVEKVDPDVIKFQEILKFIKENGREPQKTKDWSNERALWARLQGFRDKIERAEKVKKYDSLGLLKIENRPNEDFEKLTDRAVEVTELEDIFAQDELIDDFSDLLDVSRYRKTINAADKIGRRKHASNFDKYKNLFEQVHEEIANGKRKIIPFEQYDIAEGRFYVQNGVMLYIVSISKDIFTGDNGKQNARMHVVYENGTENKELLLQSLASSLYSKERHGRMITDVVDNNTIAESFSMDYTTGYIYVLESLSDNPEIKKLQNLYKIGFTLNDIETRISNAENDVTYLNAPVRVVLSAKINNVSAQKLERILHHSFKNRQVIFQDAQYKKATEWYLIPIDEIESKINEIITNLQK
ncbi:GIY-YIG nuclease family protein [Marinilactibacillus psychrotolerans]